MTFECKATNIYNLVKINNLVIDHGVGGLVINNMTLYEEDIHVSNKCFDSF